MSGASKNVGEWSEVYALAYLLANGGGFGADGKQEKVPTLFYKVLMALFRNGIDDQDLIYEIDKTEVQIYAGENKLCSVAKDVLMNKAKLLHADLITKQPGRSFPLRSGDDLIATLQKKDVSASSKARDDIALKLEDLTTKMSTPWIGFSIKSQLNASATLLNASLATNFVYEIIPGDNGVKGPIPIFGRSLKPDMRRLLDLGYTLKFEGIDHETHQQNMDLVDSQLAEYIAKCLVETTQNRNNYLSNIVEMVFPSSDRASAAKVLKIKQYLGYLMLGMKPATPWSGQPNDFGGLIFVKVSGDVLFYYLYNMEQFQEFLFNNLKFEYGKRSRHRFGTPYIVNGKSMIKLNLQLRFK